MCVRVGVRAYLYVSVRPLTRVRVSMRTCVSCMRVRGRGDVGVLSLLFALVSCVHVRARVRACVRVHLRGRSRVVAHLGLHLRVPNLSV